MQVQNSKKFIFEYNGEFIGELHKYICKGQVFLCHNHALKIFHILTKIVTYNGNTMGID